MDHIPGSGVERANAGAVNGHGRNRSVLPSLRRSDQRIHLPEPAARDGELSGARKGGTKRDSGGGCGRWSMSRGRQAILATGHGTRDSGTGADGSFQVPGCQPGEGIVSAEADGFAPAAQELPFGTNLQPVVLALGPGKSLWFRVIHLN
jgi:hypothetical protein